MSGAAGSRKIFCIGLNKTGTISLHQALTTLGFSSLHWGGQASRHAVERAIREDKPLLEYLGDYDAYSDIQRLSVNFELLDRQYPASRFILTTRDVEQWLDSRRRHVLRNRERKAQGEYDGTFLEIEPDRWRAQFVDHHRARRGVLPRSRRPPRHARHRGRRLRGAVPVPGRPDLDQAVPVEPQEHVDHSVTVAAPGRARPSQRTTVSAWCSSICRRRSSSP